MNLVQPIRDKEQLERIKRILKGNSLRDYCLFVLGINSGLRVGDLVKLKVSDVLTDKGNLKDRVWVIEKKTKKSKDFPLGESSQKALKEYLSSTKLEMADYLFPSRKENHDSKKGNYELDRRSVWRILKEAGFLAGIKEPIGSHTIRKTFGYWAYKEGYPVPLIQELLNHSSEKITLRYIGITRDDKDKVYRGLNL